MNSLCTHVPGEVTAHDDIFTLTEVFDVHHAPDKRKAKRGECENCTDEQPVDEKLNEKGYIVPGLGDAGDRLFGTK